MHRASVALSLRGGYKGRRPCVGASSAIPAALPPSLLSTCLCGVPVQSPRLQLSKMKGMLGTGQLSWALRTAPTPLHWASGQNRTHSNTSSVPRSPRELTNRDGRQKQAPWCPSGLFPKSSPAASPDHSVRTLLFCSISWLTCVWPTPPSCLSPVSLSAC